MSSDLMVDPRIAARRAQVEASSAAVEGRRRRRWAGGVIVVALILGTGALAGLSPLASVREIGVVGAERTAPELIRVASGLKEKPPLIRLDVGQITARVERLPWVRRVTVERQWPRTVVLSIEERVPAAVAPCQASSEAGCLVDETGRVLAAAPEDARSPLPRLSGVPAAGAPGSQLPDVARGALAVASNLPSALRPLVVGVRGEGNEVSLDLQAPGRDRSPPVVRLGPPDRIQEKLTAAATVLARTSVNGVAVLDVRVPESPALTRLKR